MNEIIKVTEEMTVSARDLHERLGIMTEFRKWFPRMAEYGFEEGQDFTRGVPKMSYPWWMSRNG